MATNEQYANPPFGTVAQSTGLVGSETGKSAADDFNASMQKSLQNTAVLALPKTLAGDLAQANAKVAQSQMTLAQSQANLNGTGQAALATGTARLGQIRDEQRALANAKQDTDAYTAGQQQLSQQSKDLNLNLAAIAATYGTSIPAALSLASGAQVTSNQLLGQGASNWAVISTMIAGYIAQVRVMTPSTGALNQALNALSVTQSDQIQSAQKVAQAYQQWIGIVTGGDSAFSSFEQGLSTLTDEMTQGSTAGVKLTTTSGKLTEQQKLLGTSLNGTSTSALAARQAFDSQITAAVTLYGNLQTMAAASGDTAQAQDSLAHAGKDLVAQMLPLASGSKAATAEVFALAQVAGFQGPDSFKALSQWVGNTKNAEGDLNTQTVALTESSANLTQAAKNLSAAMQDEVAGGESAAIAKATDLTQIQGQLATAVENSNGKFTDAATTLAGQHYEALIKSGDGVNDAKADVDAFLTRLGATQGVVDQVNKALASLPKTVDIAVNEMVTVSGPANAVQAAQNTLNSITHAARGAYIVKGSGPAGKDSVPAMLAPGELVIPTGHAAKYAAQAKRDGIPTYANGGLVPGFADGGTIPEPAYGSSLSSMPSTFGGASQLAPVILGGATAAGAGQQMQPATQTQMMLLIQLTQQLVKLGQQQPEAYARALNNGLGQGARRAFWNTGG